MEIRAAKAQKCVDSVLYWRKGGGERETDRERDWGWWGFLEVGDGYYAHMRFGCVGGGKKGNEVSSPFGFLFSSGDKDAE